MTRGERRARTERKVERRVEFIRCVSVRWDDPPSPGHWRKRHPFDHGYSCWACNGGPKEDAARHRLEIARKGADLE